MSFESLIAAVQRLNESLEALAALGAELRLRREAGNGDPRVRALLREAVIAVDPQSLDGIDAGQEAAILAIIQTWFRQAADLLEHPARAPGWTYEDPIMLEAQGQASRLMVGGVGALAASRPELGATLRRPGVFLDIGTGVGRLAIEAARTWPALRVVGIDSWEPALALARRNVAESGVANRIELRAQGVEQLADDAAFTLAWLPGPFIAGDIIAGALARIHRGLAPGGWLIFGFYAIPPTPLGAALTRLRVVRGGGHPWTATEAEAQLRSVGFERVETFSPAPSIVFVLGQRPVG